MGVDGSFSSASGGGGSGTSEIGVFDYTPAAADADAIKLAIATATTVRTYSGAALNGVVGGAVMDPPRPPSVTTTSATGAYNPDQQIVWTIETEDGQTTTTSINVPPNGGTTGTTTTPAKRVISIAVPAQFLTTGSFTFGFGTPCGLKSKYKYRGEASGALRYTFGALGDPGAVSLYYNLYSPESAPPYGMLSFPELSEQPDGYSRIVCLYERDNS